MKELTIIASILFCMTFHHMVSAKTAGHSSKLYGKWKVAEITDTKGRITQPKYDTYFQIEESMVFSAIIVKKEKTKKKEGSWYFLEDEFQQKWFRIDDCYSDFNGLYRITEIKRKEITISNGWKYIRLERVKLAVKTGNYQLGNSKKITGYWEMYKKKEIYSGTFEERIKTALIFDPDGKCYLSEIDEVKVDTGSWWREGQILFIHEHKRLDTVALEIISINKEEMVLLMPKAGDYRYIFLMRFSEAERKEREAVLNGSAEISNPFKGENVQWLNGYWKTIMEVDKDYARAAGDEYFEFLPSEVLKFGKINTNEARYCRWKYDTEKRAIAVFSKRGVLKFEAQIKLLTKSYLVIVVDNEKYILHRTKSPSY